MRIIEAVVLGLVQGLTEFLPVSSSGHLVLLQKIFGITAPALFFDTMLHAGTLLAVMAALWQDIWAILKKIIQPLTAFLIIATIPAVIAALAFGDAIEHAFESGRFLGVCFLITSVILITAEQLSRTGKGYHTAGQALHPPPTAAFRSKLRGIDLFVSSFARSCPCKHGRDIASFVNKEKTKSMNFIDALIIGIMQAIAIIPGISRSGAAISGALSRKLDRSFAARFSFLLSIPAILGALILQVKNLAKGETAGENITAAAIIAGTVTAAVIGFFAVKLTLKIVREKSLYGFAIYTAILGILILIDQFAAHLVF